MRRPPFVLTVVLAITLPWSVVCSSGDPVPVIAPPSPPVPLPVPMPGDPVPMPGDPAPGTVTPGTPVPVPTPRPAPTPTPTPVPAPRDDGMRALILGGGASMADAEAWRAAHAAAIGSAGVTFAPDFPMTVVSADVPGLKPGFVVVVAGYCAAGSSERVLKILEKALPDTYERVVQVNPSAGSTCPAPVP